MDIQVDMQAVQNFLRLAKGAQTKDDFISRVRQFDQKFIDAYPSPTMAPLPNIPRSNSQTAGNFKPPSQQQPPKNPFLNSTQQKIRSQKQNNTTNQIQYQTQVGPHMGRKPQMIPHSRSQTNFYKQQQQYYEDFHNGNTGYSNDFYQGDQFYNPGMINRSYSQHQPEQKQRSIYAGTQPYIQNNEYLPNYQTQQPQYVKYYKKVIPQQQPNPKANFTSTPRSNPFRPPA